MHFQHAILAGSSDSAREVLSLSHVGFAFPSFFLHALISIVSCSYSPGRPSTFCAGLIDWRCPAWALIPSLYQCAARSGSWEVAAEGKTVEWEKVRPQNTAKSNENLETVSRQITLKPLDENGQQMKPKDRSENAKIF